MSQEDLAELARAKLVKMLGQEQGVRVYDATMRELGLERLASPDVLHAFSRRLAQRGGIIAAAGAMLGLMAVMRGAQGVDESP